MFKITGLIQGQWVSVTWDNGTVDNPAITDYLTREIESRQGFYYSLHRSKRAWHRWTIHCSVTR